MFICKTQSITTVWVFGAEKKSNAACLESECSGSHLTKGKPCLSSCYFICMLKKNLK